MRTISHSYLRASFVSDLATSSRGASIDGARPFSRRLRQLRAYSPNLHRLRKQGRRARLRVFCSVRRDRRNLARGHIRHAEFVEGISERGLRPNFVMRPRELAEALDDNTHPLMEEPPISDAVVAPLANTSTRRYATFTRRFRAVVVDTAVVCAGIVIVMLVGDVTDFVPGSDRIAWLFMFGALLLYEPLLIWRRGATIGHAVNHLTVVSDRTGRAPTLVQAFARYVIKILLGVISFVTMAFTRRHQAVHDALTRTTVQLAPGMEGSVEDFHIERPDAAEAFLMPPRWRRASVMVIYLVLELFIYGILLVAIDPHGCAREGTCSEAMRRTQEAMTVVWFAGSLVIIGAAWKGLLFGARRRPKWDVEAPVV